MREIKLKAKTIYGKTIEADARELFCRAYDAIDLNTVTLSTGAKDADGVEIYEGDIVKYSEFENEPPTVGVVCFDTEEYQYFTDFDEDGFYPFSFDGLEPGYLEHATPREAKEYKTTNEIGTEHDEQLTEDDAIQQAIKALDEEISKPLEEFFLSLSEVLKSYEKISK